MTQAHVFYSGTVQGVGFRYTVRNYATQAEIHGWVRNLSDGRVELLAEGTPDQISRFLESVDEHFADCIQDRTVEYSPAQGQIRNFSIVA